MVIADDFCDRYIPLFIEITLVNKALQKSTITNC